MDERRQPLKALLKEPELPVEALWRRIAVRRGRAIPPTRLPGFATAVAAVFAVAVFGVIYAVPRVTHEWQRSSTAEREGRAGVLRRANGELLGVLDTRQSSAGLDVALSDGSQIHIAPGARLVPKRSDRHQFHAAIDRGKILFDVQPQHRRRWLIDAGDTRVTVIGTRFSVEHEAGRVQVSVERGRVEVRGPRVPQGVQLLGQGERLALSPEAPAMDPARQADSAAPPVRARAEPRAAPLPRGAAERSRAPSVDALLEDADAARLSGQYRVAERLLSRILTEHAADSRASLVALTLGRLQLDHLAAPRSAAASFARADALGLPGALAEEGAARQVEAYAKAGERELARAAAERYRRRFERGPRSAQVAAWIDFD